MFAIDAHEIVRFLSLSVCNSRSFATFVLLFLKDIEDLGILEFHDSSSVPFPNFLQKGTEMPNKTLDGTVCYHVQSIG